MFVTSNGRTLTGPTLIYHDEITIITAMDAQISIGDINSQGALICRSETRPRVSWHFTDGDFVEDANSNVSDVLQQVRNGAEDVPSLARLSRSSAADLSVMGLEKFNGLFICRVNMDDDLDDTLDNFVHVGIYAREDPQSELDFVVLGYCATL